MTDASLDTTADADSGESEHACPYCDRVFARGDYRDLHLGVEHDRDRLTDAERAAFAAARETEEEELTIFRYKALGLLVVAYFLFLMAYAVSL